MMGVAVLFVYLGVVILVFGGIIALQVYLSGKRNKWLGLIIPIISLILSIGAVALTPSNNYKKVVSTKTSNGQIVSETVETNDNNGAGEIVRVLTQLGLANIPTIIYMGIYFGRREKFRSEKDMDKMKVQDL